MEPVTYKIAPPAIRVLLVEDDAEMASLTCSHISDDRDKLFQVEWKDDIEKAMSRLAEPGINVVLLDLGMNELGGYKTHMAINSVVGKTIPVVILTSDESSVSRDITLEMGAAGYMVKSRTSPIELRETLFEAVVQWARPPVGQPKK
jgi:DNA-binding response OmpR family regulator